MQCQVGVQSRDATIPVQEGVHPCQSVVCCGQCHDRGFATPAVAIDFFPSAQKSCKCRCIGCFMDPHRNATGADLARREQ